MTTVVKAADTNILVRFLTMDDQRQSRTAEEIVRAGLFVPHSVLIETEWVLRSGYRWNAARINEEFTDFLAIEGIEVDQPDALLWALDRHKAGADWADMLHLIASTGHTVFVTFDRELAAHAGPGSPIPIELLS